MLAGAIGCAFNFPSLDLGFVLGVQVLDLLHALTEPRGRGGALPRGDFGLGLDFYHSARIFGTPPRSPPPPTPRGVIFVMPVCAACWLVLCNEMLSRSAPSGHRDARRHRPHL